MTLPNAAHHLLVSPPLTQRADYAALTGTASVAETAIVMMGQLVQEGVALAQGHWCLGKPWPSLSQVRLVAEAGALGLATGCSCPLIPS